MKGNYQTFYKKAIEEKTGYVTKDGMGYMITFVSTPETFDKNLKVFESFKSRIKFD